MDDKNLTPEQFHICREKGTEPAFTGKYWDCKEDGLYLCVCCGQALFDSAVKYDSGSGWPSFWQPVSKNASLVQRSPCFKNVSLRSKVICLESESNCSVSSSVRVTSEFIRAIS